MLSVQDRSVPKIEPQRRDERRPAIPVVSRVPDVLNIGTHLQIVTESSQVVTLDEGFRSVTQRTVAEEEAQASRDRKSVV